MAIEIATSLLGKVGEIVAEKALDEASLLLNFKNDFKWLQKKLRKIIPSLEAADDQSGQSEDVKDWLADVRNIAFDAEDIIDECAVQHLYTNPSRYNCSQLVFRWKMGRRIRGLKDRIRSAIQLEASDLKLLHDVSHLNQPSTSSTSQSERGEVTKWSILENDTHIAVGLDYKVDEILRLLDNPSIGVAAVLGMGGLGKTFLLHHLYNREKHSEVSDLRAAQLIREKLDGRRCLIVLDDVWRSSAEGNLVSRLGLPTGRSSNQCKVVVSTRSRGVAETLNAEYIYEMQHLSNDESWDLFCQIAFRDRERSIPSELESLAHQIVKECGRLPLALKTVAASMTKSPFRSVWESRLEQLKKITNTEDPTIKILKLSYDSLPPHLKRCFAYFAFFPEDTYFLFSFFHVFKVDIYEDYVISLWIAEGFIPQEEGRDQWDTALHYLHQLEDLCLLERNNVSNCYTIHDMLLDLAVNICKERDCEFDLPSKESSCRRLVVGKKDIGTNQISERPLNCQRYLRTLSFSQNPGIRSIPEQLFENVRLLRVIDLSRTAISTLPRGVGNLKLLKVLNLSCTEFREVPECVRTLKSLQYLDLSYCKSLQRLPSWIGELKSLFYLNTQSTYIFHMPKGMSQLSSLRTLKSDYFTLFYDENDEFLSVKDAGNLTNLKELRFCLKDARGLRSVEDGILGRLVNMRILGVANLLEESSLPSFPQRMIVMKDLQLLNLSRFSVPSWLRGMENLTELCLDRCSDYPPLQKMPNLRMLTLLRDSKCRELAKELGESGGFPKLARLVIKDVSILEELPALEEGAMQRLESLLIVSCPRVKGVPEGLERARRLKGIVVVNERSGELEEGGEDWSRIKANNSRIEIFLY